MSYSRNKIEWKQNRMHLSEVFIKLSYSSDEATEFLMEEEIVNHLFSKRNEEIEMHLKFNVSSDERIYPADFSKLRRVKPVYPLLQQGITLPKIKKESGDKVKKVGTYAIFHKASLTWLGREGWSSARKDFDIIPERIVKTFLNVTLSPPEAVESGALWRIKDGTWQNSLTSLPVTTGAYLLEFKSVSGWESPKPEQIQVVEGIDEKISVDYSLLESKFLADKGKFVFVIFLTLFLIAAGLHYLLSPNPSGNIVANISPAEVMQNGAKWRIDNGDWQDSGTSIHLESGEHVIEFMPVAGWERPKKQNITLEKGQDAQIDKPYAKLMTIYLKPEEAIKNGAQWKISGDTQWRDSGDKIALQIKGRQEIIFKDIANWVTPPKRSLSYKDSTLNAQYEQKSFIATQASRSITVEIQPDAAIRAGAQWKIKGPGNWKSSGETLTGLINIPYTVIFRNIDGWKKPGSKKIKINGPGNILKEGVYENISDISEGDRP